MVWRKSSPLARQLHQISEAVCLSAGKTRQRPVTQPALRSIKA
jgi:LysR family hydrogen peroxide-inducible transcriptional activator